MEAPKAKKIPHKLEKHGDVRIDDYYWLNQREDKEVVDYLKSENSFFKSKMKDTEGLQKDLYEEIVARIKKDDDSVPYRKNGYYYQTRYRGDSEYPLYLRWKEGEESKEEVLLDVNEMAKGFEYYNCSYFYVSPDNKKIVFGIDNVSRRLYKLYIKDLETGELFEEVIENTTGSATWAKDNQHIFYTLRDEQTLRSHTVMKHKLGDDPANDVKVFFEEDEAYSSAVFGTSSGNYIFIGSFSTLSTEYCFINADDPHAAFQVIIPRSEKHEYYISEAKDTFYIKSNDQAKNFRVLSLDPKLSGLENCKEIIAHDDKVLIEDIESFDDFMVIEERYNGLTRLKVLEFAEMESHFVEMDEEAYTIYSAMNSENHVDYFRFGYSSLTTPSSVYEYDLKDRTYKILKQQEVLGTFDKKNYETKRLFATAEDKVQVPITLVYRKGMQLNGKNPLLLYGYGSYGHSIDPFFGSSRLSLLDRGFVFAIAHIRGGEEMGRDWYEDGKMMKKKNTFTDFISCAEFLIQESYTSKEHIYAMGGSAGGLLMGAVVNLKPELFNGVIAAVPFVDVITTMLDDSIPLTTGEYNEWGNPNEKEAYDYMLSYSPYDQLQEGYYPNMLVTTGLHDSQVQYWEPAKWVARIRELNTSTNMILLHTNMDAGHGGASGRFKAYKETARDYSFLLKLEGIKE